MKIKVNQPLKIELEIRVTSLAILTFAALVLMFTCYHERHSASMENETANLADSAYLTSVDTMNTEMRMAIERAVVLKRVKDIYELVRNEYVCHDASYEYEWIDRAFCSKSWNKLLMAVRCKEEETGTLFFEIDRWSMLRYPDSFVSFEEFEVRDLWIDGNQKRASVSFVVCDDDTYTPASIDLVYEDDRWVIDDFHNLRYMLDLRSCMWNYLVHDIV